MGIPEPNVVVKRNSKGGLRVYVGGQLMAGVTKVGIEGHSGESILKLEVTGRFVTIEEMPSDPKVS
jgi:hypothetical protein